MATMAPFASPPDLPFFGPLLPSPAPPAPPVSFGAPLPLVGRVAWPMLVALLSAMDWLTVATTFFWAALQ